MGVKMEEDQIKCMKYAELQKLAKSVGIRANVKCEKLRQKLLTHIRQQENCDSTVEQSSEDEEVVVGKKSRKNSQSEPDISQSSEDDEIVIPTKAPKKRGRRGQKAAKASPQSIVPETPPEPTLPAAKTPQVLKAKGRFFATPKASPVAKSLTPVRSPAVSKSSPLVVKATPTGTPSRGTPAGKRASSTPKLSAPLRGTPSSLKKRVTPKVTPGKSPKATPGSLKKSASKSTSGSVKKSPGSAKRRSGRLSKSPVVQEMLAAMKDGMTDQELKDSLLATLEKSATEKLGAERSEEEGERPVTSQIPRFAAFALKKKAEQDKVTPGARWQKAHTKAFGKMDSLDDYLEKKRKRTESLQTSVKKARLIAEKTRSAIDSLKKCRTPPVSANKPRPPPASRTALFKSPHVGVPFVPKVMSVSKINTNFSAIKTPSIVQNKPKPNLTSATKENQPRKSIGASRKSIGVDRKSVGAARKSMGAERKSLGANRKSLGANRKSLGANRKSFGANKTFNVDSDNEISFNKTSTITPFKFSANPVQPASVPRAKFDLTASLAKPVTWKPHKGKLPTFSAKRQDPKEVRVKTIEERRQQLREIQAKQRQAARMNRRGIQA